VGRYFRSVVVLQWTAVCGVYRRDKGGLSAKVAFIGFYNGTSFEFELILLSGKSSTAIGRGSEGYTL
jgi:hypothetical protein